METFPRSDGRLRRPGEIPDQVRRREHIYPAEFERVLLAEPRVADAAVVRRPDPKWGGVPVAFVARYDHSLDVAELFARRRAELAGYKQPKDIRFIADGEFPRSASGKIQRYDLEKRPTEGERS